MAAAVRRFLGAHDLENERHDGSPDPFPSRACCPLRRAYIQCSHALSKRASRKRKCTFQTSQLSPGVSGFELAREMCPAVDTKWTQAAARAARFRDRVGPGMSVISLGF